MDSAELSSLRLKFENYRDNREAHLELSESEVEALYIIIRIAELYNKIKHRDS